MLCAWLSRVKEELPGLAAKLQQLRQCQPKKTKGEASKNPKGRGEGKSRGVAPEKPAAPAPKKLKLLCLHGYRQSGKAAREKLGSFRKAVSNVSLNKS